MAMQLHMFDRPDRGKAAQRAQVSQNSLRIAQRNIGDEDLAPGQLREPGGQPFFGAQQQGDFKVVAAVQEGMRVDAMVAHHAKHRGTVALPVARAQRRWRSPRPRPTTP